MNRRIFALLTAIIFILTCIPAAAAGFAPRYETPVPYNDHDYQAVLAFLETEDENGVKNGDKICDRIGTEYDPEDPSTWSAYSEDHGYPFGFVFAYDYTQEMRLWMCLLGDSFTAEDGDEVKPTGDLDLSGCTALVRVEAVLTNITSVNVSGCRSLSILYCFNDPIYTMDLSGCTALRDICCADTFLSEIDASDCENLEILWCWNCLLEDIDLTGCRKLKDLDCSINGLTELDLSGCPELEQLWCTQTSVASLDLSDKHDLYAAYVSENPGLASLDLTGCTALTELYCYSCALTELDLSDCTALEYMWAYYNQITEFDFSNNTALYDISLSYNLLTELDLSNLAELHYIDCIRNRLTEIDFTHNPYIWFDHLTAEGGGEIGTNYIDHILVAMAYGLDGNHFVEWRTEDGETITDDYILSSAETDETRAVAVFEADEYEAAPAEFTPRTAPKHHTADRGVEEYNEHDYSAVLAFMEITDENGVKNGEKIAERVGKVYDPEDPMTWTGYCEDTGYGAGAVFMYDNSATKRLVAFLLSDLFWMDEDLGTTPCGDIDLSDCVVLYRVETGYTGVTGVDLDGANALTTGYFFESPISELSVGGCTTLYELMFDTTGVGEIDVTDSPNLECLWFWSTDVAEVDVSNCPHLKTINCGYTLVSELDVSNNPELTELKSYGTPLSTLIMEGNNALEYLNVQSTEVGSLDLSACPSLIRLHAYDSKLTELDVSPCHDLKYLYCGGNEIAELDVSGCPSLVILSCEYNEISELDLSNNPLLARVSCFMNRLTDIDFTNNPLFPIETVSCVGHGNIGTGYRDDALAVTAIADEGWHFVEWHTEDGEFITDEHLFFLDESGYTTFVAVFEPDDFIPGDVNGDGEVDVNDALLVMRHALGLIELENTYAADVNGDGTVNLEDALLILRTAMGLI